VYSSSQSDVSFDLKVVLSFRGAAIVSLGNGENSGGNVYRPADIRVESSKVIEKNGSLGVEVVFYNDGDVHGYLANAKFIIFFDNLGWQKGLNSSEISDAIGLGLVLPSHKR
jgi:hypothetical protein